MQLFSGPLCPYASRVRVQIRYKNAPVEIVSPPTGVRTEEYRSLNPLGRIPLLKIDDHVFLPESEAIAEFLEDRFEEVPLRPKDPVQRGWMRVVARIPELYIYPSALALLQALRLQDRDHSLVAQKIEALKRTAAQLDEILGLHAGQFSIRDEFTLADCALTPGLFYLAKSLSSHGVEPFDDGTPALNAYWLRLKVQPVPAGVMDEIAVALDNELAT